MEQIKRAIDKFTSFTSIKTIMFLAIPAMIENISQVFIGVVDTYFVGKLGTEAIAGVGVTNLTMNVYIAFFLALGIGTTAIVSRFVGAGDNENANHAVKQSLIMSITIGLGFGIINLIFAKQILLLLGAENRVIEYALPYFFAVAVPSVFLCVNMVLSSALRGAGDTKTPMKIAILANIINAILDYVLIFGIFSFISLFTPTAGLVGEKLAEYYYIAFGVGSFVIPVILLYWGSTLIYKKGFIINTRVIGFLIVFISST